MQAAGNVLPRDRVLRNKRDDVVNMMRNPCIRCASVGLGVNSHDLPQLLFGQPFRRGLHLAQFILPNVRSITGRAVPDFFVIFADHRFAVIAPAVAQLCRSGGIALLERLLASRTATACALTRRDVPMLARNACKVVEGVTVECTLSCGW